jgi:hypothetical protein
MIDSLITEYRKHERDINILVFGLVVLLLALTVRAMIFGYKGNFDGLWSLIGPAAPLIAVLLVVRVANRLIARDEIIRQDDRQKEVMRISHHLIAITKDLKGRVCFMANALENGSPMLSISQTQSRLRTGTRHCLKVNPTNIFRANALTS